jgi:hypothetical protein
VRSERSACGLGFGFWVLGFALCFMLASSEPAAAQVNMPDPSQINGKALPAPELPDSTITVRVVREAIGNNVPGQDVRIVIGGTRRTAKTDEQGRATFSDLPHDQGRAEVTVDGEELVSDPFNVPASGGLRVILVAGIARAAERKKQEEAAAAAAPAVRGVVAFGNNTRVLMQFQDDTLQVFYVLEIVNNARTRVDIGGPLIIDLPPGAGGAAVLPGSSPSAQVMGNRLTILGPFAAGTTNVQLGYQLRYDSPDIVFTQKFPAALQVVTVGVQKAGQLGASSSQFAKTSDLTTDDGTVFIVGNGPALAAGTPLTVNLTSLPLHSRVPRYTALAIAGIVIAVGIWLAASTRGRDAKARQALVARRESLLADLEQLELKSRSGAVNQDRYNSRRRKLMADLEQIYAELDDTEAGGPGGGGEGVAA